MSKQINIPPPIRKTTYEYIREYLRDSTGKKKPFVMGGTLESVVSAKTGSKGSTTSRRLREMTEAGELEVKYIKEFKNAVAYKLA